MFVNDFFAPSPTGLSTPDVSWSLFLLNSIHLPLQLRLGGEPDAYRFGGFPTKTVVPWPAWKRETCTVVPPSATA